MTLRRLVLTAFCALLLAVPAGAQDRVVNVFNWNDYIDPYMVQRFTRETGIRVRYDVFDSLETLEGRMSAGRTGYDIVVPTSEPTFSRLARAGAFRPLDRAAVPNLANLDPALMRQVESSDPGNRFGVPYLWGTIGLGLNAERIRAAAPDAPLSVAVPLFRIFPGWNIAELCPSVTIGSTVVQVFVLTSSLRVGAVCSFAPASSTVPSGITYMNG